MTSRGCNQKKFGGFDFGWGIQYMVSMMHKCILIKVGGSQRKRERTKLGRFINLAELWGICSMYHRLREMGLHCLWAYFYAFLGFYDRNGFILGGLNPENL